MKYLVFFFLLFSFDALAAKPVFEALSGHHNLDPWNHVLGVPEPSFVWSGDDVNGSDDSCVETGTTAAVTTPFCEHGHCLQARRFELNEYYTCGDRLGLSDFSKISLISISRKGPAGGDDKIAAHSVAGLEGWTLYHGATDYVNLYMQSDGGGNPAVGSTSASDGEWVLSCGTMNDTDHTVFMHSNGIEDSTSLVIPTGSYGDGSVLEIGTQAAGTGDMVGDIALVAGWEGTELTYAQCKAIFHAFFDWYEPRGKSPITWSNTGPTSAFVNGSIETFSDDFPRVGVEVAPGLTGAGTPSVCGAHLHPSVANYIIYSQDLSSGWTTVGTDVLSTGSAGAPRASGQGYYIVTDNDAGVTEYVYEITATAATGGASAADVFTLGAMVNGTLGETYTIGVGQATGALCTSGTTYTDFVSSGAWEVVEANHTYTDEDCANISTSIFPVDFSDGVTATGALSVAYAALTKNQTFGSLLCDTAGAAVTCGADATVSYVDSADNLLMTSAGEFKGNYRVLLGVSPFGVFSGNDDILWTWFKDGNDRLQYYALTNGDINLYHVDGGVATSIMATPDPTWTVGVTYSLDNFFNFDRNSYRATIRGISTVHDTDSLATPSGMTGFRVGIANYENGACVGPVRIYR